MPTKLLCFASTKPVLPHPFRILSPDHTIFIPHNSFVLKVRSIIPAAHSASPKSSSPRSSRQTPIAAHRSPEPRLFLSACGVADLHPPPPFPLPRLRPPPSVLSYLATTLPACLDLHVLSPRLEISRTTSPHLLLHPDASSSASFPYVNPVSQSTFKSSATNGNVVETHKEYVSSPRLSCADCIALRHRQNPVPPGALVLNADTPGQSSRRRTWGR